MQAVLTKPDMSKLLKMAKVDTNTQAVVTYVSPVKTASAKNNSNVAANPNVEIVKHVMATVTLFKDADSDLYLKSVRESAREIGVNTSGEIKKFEVSTPAYFHTDIYSVVQNRVSGKQYLYAHYISAESEYFIDGMVASKQEVAEYLTPSEAKKLLEPSTLVYNAQHDIHHAVVVRTIALENVRSIVIV